MHLSTEVERVAVFTNSLLTDQVPPFQQTFLCLSDPHDPPKTRHSMQEIIGFQFMMIASGYEDGNDANKVRYDPSFELALEHAPGTGSALRSQPTISRMNNITDTRSLIKMGHRGGQVYCDSFKRPPKQFVLDIDDTFDSVHGEQQLRLFNNYDDGEFGYQPIDL